MKLPKLIHRLFDWMDSQDKNYAEFRSRLDRDPRRELFVQKIRCIILENNNTEKSALAIMELLFPTTPSTDERQ